MRYILLVILNLPILFLAFLNIITQYKMKKISKQRFYRQFFMWTVILLIIIGSFPVYNTLRNLPPLFSPTLTSFDIAEITAITFIFYALNSQIRKLDRTERKLRDLHQELSIKISEIEKNRD